jgi:anti-sigma B factor antagonist
MALSIDVGGKTQDGAQVSTVVKLVGSLDADTVTQAEKAVKPLLVAPPKVLVFDLAGLSFVSSAGIGLMISARKSVEAKGGACYFSGPQPQIRKVFEIMKALPTASVFGSVRELDEYLTEMQRKVTDGD